MKFKKGDRVRLRKDSGYYADQGGHGIGTIKGADGGYSVTFDDGYYNGYHDCDLERAESINDRLGRNK